ncbi:hypothetical protein QA811_43855 [Streptomyces sp. B21-102]|uniref:hypothetical protein n=1 Tax=Streptomyces sp. B21-102 TaxID=3039416 RepID=UPI002FF3D26D
MSTSGGSAGGSASSGGTTGGSPTTGGTTGGSPTTGGTTGGSPTTGGERTRSFLAEALDPDAAQDGQSLRRISAKKALAVLAVFLVGILTTYAYTHILADDAAEVADKAADNLDKSKPAIDADLSYIPPAEQLAGEVDYWEFDRILTQVDVDAINKSNVSDSQLRKELSELGGRRVLGRRGDPENAPLPYLSMRLELSSQRGGVITIKRIYAKTIKCTESTARSALIPAPSGGVSNRDGLVFDFTQAENPGDTVDALDDASGKPYLTVKGVALQNNLEPAFMNISVASDRGCEWSLHLEYYVSADHETKDIAVKVGKENPSFKFTPSGGTSQLITRDGYGIYSIIP